MKPINARRVLRADIALYAALLVTCLHVPALAQVNANRSTSTVARVRIPILIARIRTARTRVEQYVVDLKRIFKNDEATLNEAKKLYDDAFSKYDGWVAATKAAIREGSAKKLNEDTEYVSRAEAAVKAGDAFVNYAIEKTQARRGGLLSAIGPLAEVGIKFWNEWKKGSRERRAQDADYFEKETQWRPWAKIE